jgi:monofunctional biosynthetic peptidoglycan transglycosylase
VLLWLARDLPRPEAALDAARRPSLTMEDAGGHVFATYGDVVGEPVRLRDLPAYVPQAVVAVEDRRFWQEPGIDPIGLARAALTNILRRRIVQGGSTITQQVAKNLFLWPGRSVARKALEFPLAMWIDAVLSKQRILEIYLNIAEWGPGGQFGAEAGSRYAFGRSAANLSAREAALMASILPNPVKRSARKPGPGVRRLAGTYMARAQAAELRSCWRENRG